MRVDARGLQIRVSESLRDERNRCPLVDSVARMRVTKPVGGDGGIDTSQLRCGLHDIVDPPLHDEE